MIKVGAEYIKRVEVQYCELCKVYLPRSENTERAVALHCSTRSHLKRYITSMLIRRSELMGKLLQFVVFTIVIYVADTYEIMTTRHLDVKRKEYICNRHLQRMRTLPIPP